MNFVWLGNCFYIKMNYKIISLLLVVFLAAGSAYFQREALAVQAPSEHELTLLDLVNQARVNPRAAISGIGLDPDSVARSIPALAGVLDAGMEPLAFQPQLYAAARKHTLDMFEYSQVGRILPDGLSPMDRAREEGYPAMEAGVSAAGVVFQNFIAPENALQNIFRSMLLDELTPGAGKDLVLLNPAFSETGITLVPGEIVLAGHTRKGYLSSCLSGYSLGEEIADLLFEMVNMVRDQPELFLREAGFEHVLAEEGSPDSVSDFRRLPPMARDERLTSAGLIHVFDIEKYLYYGPVSPSGQDPLSRIAEFGYDAAGAASPLAFAEIREGMSAGDYAFELFEQLVGQEISSPDGPGHILSDWFTEIGLGVGIITLETSPEDEVSFVLLSAHLARPDQPRLFAVGGAYRSLKDELGDEYWEGLAGLRIELVELTGDVLVSSITGRNGLFQVPFIQGMKKINLYYNGRVIASKALIMPQKNVYVNFVLRGNH
jgi:uncharacterized protein YkwD